MVVVEICCGSYEDALAAQRGGAKRIELNSALHLGGLTPSLASLKLTKENTDLKVIAMVRPRGAGFCYGVEEVDTIFADARLLLEEGADGIAFGFLNSDGEVDTVLTKKMVKLIHSFNKEAIFHRAFDCTPDAEIALEELIQCQVNRILTSGLEANASLGKETIKKLSALAKGRIEILMGSGINSDNAKQLIEATGVSQIHSSCKDWKEDKTTTRNGVSFAYHNLSDYEVVSEKKVRELIAALN
ncbi:MAG: copper homeostasis protein CutC [Anaerorhabdus sp.]